MKEKEFKELLTFRLNNCMKVLGYKATEYVNGEDRLSNFKTAAALQGCTPERALGGMLSKHVVALFDFIDKEEGDYDRWIEKITDTINYCLLLEGLITERLRSKE